MVESQLKIFVIVVTYKGMHWYDRCFTSLRNSTIPIQTIVVDNASGDGTVDYIKENFPEITLIESKENLGFGKGNNLAMKYAYEHGCDYVFLLNQDAWLNQDDTLEKLVDVAQRHPEFGILSPMHLNVNKTELSMKEFCRQPCNEKLISDMYLNKLSDIYDTTYIHAAAWMLSKHTLQIVGGFDPIFPHYGEDDDYLHRVLFHKLKVGVCPQVSIVHDHHDHPKSDAQLLYFHNLNKLVEYLDINHSFKFGKRLRLYFKKWMHSVCHFDLKQSRSVKRDMRFLCGNVKEIKRHRNQNMTMGNTWLQVEPE